MLSLNKSEVPAPVVYNWEIDNPATILNRNRFRCGGNFDILHDTLLSVSRGNI